MKKLLSFLILTGVLLVSGCNTVKTSADYVPTSAREFSSPRELVFDEAVSTLMSLRWHVTSSSRDSGFIQARTPMTMWTYGDLVNIHVRSGRAGKTRVDATSASDQQFDWGKNQENIQAFYSKLRSNLK